MNNVAHLKNARICLAGKNQIAVDALLYMVGRGWKDRLLVCPNRTDDGISRWQPSLLRFAREFDIAVVSLEEVQEMDNLVFLSLEFDQIISPAAFKTERLYNIHFSALPAYKGMYTSALPILHGANFSGVTLHEIDHGIDTGPIIDQDVFALPQTWTARDLYFEYMKRGTALFVKQIDRLVSNEPPVKRAQPAVGSTYFSKSAINYSNVAINLRDTAEGVVRQLRAFSFREYQVPNVKDMEISGWQILPERSKHAPGSVLEVANDSITIATIDFDVHLERFRDLDWCELVANGEIDPRRINCSDKMGWTPLMRAAYSGDLVRSKMLLANGADPNMTNMNGTTPLMYALSSKNAEEGKQVARLLLKFGANPDQPDHFGRKLTFYHPGALVWLAI